MAETFAQALSNLNNSESRITIEKLFQIVISQLEAYTGSSIDAITDLANINSIQFNLDPTLGSHEVGQMHWDADNNTVSIGMIGGTVELQVGQEHLIYVFNHSGVDIPNGSAVYISDAGDSKPRIALADADNTDPIPEASVIGLATELIAKNAQGFVTTQGIVRGLDTSGITEGVPLWLSTTPGEWQEARPDAPNVNVAIGYCIYAHNNKGIILVSPIVLPKVTGLSDVYGTPSNGDTIRWNAANDRFEFGA